MNKGPIFAAALLAAGPLAAADVSIQVETPYRAPRDASAVPGAVEVILPRQLESAAGGTIDQKLQSLVPGLNTNREGIYYHGSNLSMRGMPGGETGQAMTLVLVDGVPLNSAATGGVQWTALNSLDIDRIEVFRGPGSSAYGSNAMAGVVNVITRKVKKGYSLETSYGTYDTFSAAARAGVTSGRLGLQLSGGYLNSKGYYQTSDSARAATDRKLAVESRSAGAKAAYSLKDLGDLSMGYDHYKGNYREGVQYPGYPAARREKTEDRMQAGWKGARDGWYWNGGAYYEHHADERLSQKNASSLPSYAHIKRNDLGALTSVSKDLPNGLAASGGLDFRFGTVNGHDNSMNAAPYSYDKGKTLNLAPYAQLEKKLFSDRLGLTAGLRYDNVSVLDGYTRNTQEGLEINLPDKYWDQFSPKAAASWKYGEKFSQYLSWSRGFRAPTLESMVLSIKRGTRYQAPNPALRPETAATAETGFKANPLEGLYVEPAAYFTRARDLIYFNYYTVGATNYQQYSNLAKADIYGFEVPVKYLNGGLSLTASYAQAHSEVKEGLAAGVSLEGKQVTGSPRHIYSAGVSYAFGEYSAGAGWTHKSRQFTNDANTTSIGGYSTASANLSRKFGENLTVSAACDNLFNERHMESTSGYLAPGRTLTASLKLSF